MNSFIMDLLQLCTLALLMVEMDILIKVIDLPLYHRISRPILQLMWYVWWTKSQNPTSKYKNCDYMRHFGLVWLLWLLQFSYINLICFSLIMSFKWVVHYWILSWLIMKWACQILGSLFCELISINGHGNITWEKDGIMFPSNLRRCQST